MSQVYKSLVSGPVPPSVATSFVTDEGTAIPAANILNINGGQGIVVIADPDLSNNVLISLLEPTYEGTAKTINVQTVTAITVTPTDNRSFSIQSLVTGYDAGNNLLIGGEGISSGKKVGGVVSIIDSDYTIHKELVADVPGTGLAEASFQISPSGADFILTVTGVAGSTIDWKGIIDVVESPLP